MAMKANLRAWYSLPNYNLFYRHTNRKTLAYTVYTFL